MKELIITLAIVVAAITNATMDKLQFHYSSSKYFPQHDQETFMGKGERFWNPSRVCAIVSSRISSRIS